MNSRSTLVYRAPEAVTTPLAEVDLGVDGSMPSFVPGDPVREVTADERFTGGALAVTSSAQLRRMLADYGLA